MVIKRKVRVLVLHNSLSPYRIPLFEEISKSSELHVDFLFSRVREVDRLWQFDTNLGFNYTVIKAPELRIKNKVLCFWVGVKGFSKKYDLFVINDHINIPEFAVLCYAKIFRKPILRWIATTENSIQLESKLSQIIKAWLNRNSTIILVPGSEARDYALKTTDSKVPVMICNNVVDNKLFSVVRSYKEKDIHGRREQLNLCGTVISYFGQLVPRKGLDVLIDAIKKLPDDLEFSLLLVGEGELLSEAEKVFLNKKAKLVATGYVKPEILPEYYSLIDVFVLPSHVDTWGMVVNEAMAAGKPVICSTGAGAHRDLISHGKSGFIFDKNDSQMLSEQLLKVIKDEKLRTSMKAYGDAKLGDYTIETASHQFCKAVKSAITRVL